MMPNDTTNNVKWGEEREEGREEEVHWRQKPPGSSWGHCSLQRVSLSSLWALLLVSHHENIVRQLARWYSSILAAICKVYLVENWSSSCQIFRTLTNVLQKETLKNILRSLMFNFKKIVKKFKLCDKSTNKLSSNRCF